ncbi:hypothetical protein RUM44_009845 [Polyplax serrata]|uniref:RING-type domain-containing protein n=1 Tax=Polyplax serrata TaxID=468196 RepID=A0ABR1AVC5_POLSC
MSYITGQILVDNFLAVCSFVSKLVWCIFRTIPVVGEDALIFIEDASDKISFTISLLNDFCLFLQSLFTLGLSYIQKFIMFLLWATDCSLTLIQQSGRTLLTLIDILQYTGFLIWRMTVGISRLFSQYCCATVNLFDDIKNTLVKFICYLFTYMFNVMGEFYSAVEKIELESVCGLLIGAIFVFLVYWKFKGLCDSIKVIVYKMFHYAKLVAVSVYTGRFLDHRKPENIPTVSPRQIDEERLCVICQYNPKEMIIFPCKHLCLCWECSRTLGGRYETCPLCRTRIKEFLKVYW